MVGAGDLPRALRHGRPTRGCCSTGITQHPDTPWMMPMTRQPTATIDGMLLRQRCRIQHGDTKYSPARGEISCRERAPK